MKTKMFPDSIEYLSCSSERSFLRLRFNFCAIFLMVVFGAIGMVIASEPSSTVLLEHDSERNDEYMVIPRIGVLSVFPKTKGDTFLYPGFSLLVRKQCFNRSGVGGELGGWGNDREGGYSYHYLLGSYWQLGLMHLGKGTVGYAISVGVIYGSFRAGLVDDIAEGWGPVSALSVYYLYPARLRRSLFIDDLLSQLKMYYYISYDVMPAYIPMRINVNTDSNSDGIPEYRAGEILRDVSYWRISPGSLWIGFSVLF
jgi:hypothetical protein